MTAAIEFRNVDIIFGENAAEAQKLARAGVSRTEILSRTGAVLGATGANLTVNEGEISVLAALQARRRDILEVIMDAERMQEDLRCGLAGQPGAQRQRGHGREGDAAQRAGGGAAGKAHRQWVRSVHRGLLKQLEAA